MNHLNRHYHDFKTATLWFFRSLKQGDWLWLFLAVALASLSVTTVDLLAKTVKQSMLRDAANQLGADLVLKSTRPLNPDFIAQAQALGLQTAQSISLMTMASQGDRFKLVQLKGISPNTPLRGHLNAKALFNSTQTTLTPTTLWIEQSLISELGITAQTNQITLGTQTFQVVATLTSSGLATGMSSFAPSIWIDLDALPNTQLLGPGSRSNFELSLAGDPKAIQDFSEAISPLLDSSTQLISAQAPNEDLARSLDTAWLFLDLAALSAVLVAGLSILIASRFYVQRWQTQVALLRALGATAPSIRRLLTWQLMWLGFLASGLGFVLGSVLFQGLWPWLSQFFDSPVTPDYVTTLFKSWALGLLVLWSFTWLALQSALQTSPMALFRQGQFNPSLGHWLISFGLLLSLMGLIIQSATPKQMAWILLGLIGVGALLYLSASLLLKGIAIWQTQTQGWFKLALATLSREPGLVKIQLVSVGLVLFVLMLLTFVRQDLMQSWQASLPNDTPDTFVMNVQPDQKLITQQHLQKAQVTPELVPMVKGRLVQINQTPILPSEQIQARAKRLLEREANIALLASPPNYNQIVAQTTSDSTSGLASVSVEQDIAQLFNIQLGDHLTFNFSGQEFTYSVNSIRAVQWQSFRLNFFFIITPSKTTETLPISYISSFKMPNPESVNPLQKALSEDAPGVLLIDVKGVLTQIQTIMSQASWAVSALYSLTLMASILVLLSATQASQQSRVQSWMLLKTLGARQSVILKMGLMEFILLGALAGIIAASLAQLASLLFSVMVLKITPSLNLELWFSALTLGILGWLLMGWLTQRRYLLRSAKALSRYEG